MKDGQASVFENNNQNLFTGAVAVVCRNGQLTVGKKTCEPTSPTDCAVSKSQWYGEDGASCHHDFQSQIIKSGASMRVDSLSGIGHIDYKCESGNLSVQKMNCGVQRTEDEVAKINKAAVLKTQSLTSTKNYEFSLVMISSHYTSGVSSAVTADAIKKCMEISGFSDSANVTYNYVRPFNRNYEYQVRCPLSVPDMRCDQEVVSALTMGSFNSREGEFTNPPDNARVSKVCANRGFVSGYNDLRYSKLEHPGEVDNFRVIMQCSGKDALCDDVKPPLGSPHIATPTSCFDSTVRSGLLEVPSGNAVSTAKVLAEVCEPLGFTGLDSMTTPRMDDQTGAFDYYTTTASCTGYQYSNSQPLMPSCGTNIPSNGAAVVDFINCDSANVSGTLSADRNPVTGENTLPPSPNTVTEHLCNANNFTTLDKIVTSAKSGGNDTMFEVTAQCSGYSGPERAECATNTECFGRVLPNNTQEPYLEVDGTKYFNKCYSKTSNPDELCEECGAGTFSFTDPVTKNTCSINVSKMISGDSTNIPFLNTSINGEVDIKCNNGELSVNGTSHCYKTCPGGVTLGWNDARGAQNCGQRVPNGSYEHQQRVSFQSSMTNTGAAEFECNGYTGEWEVVYGACELDCSGTESWGSGTSNSGQSKNNACSAALPTVKHGASGTINSTASLTSGKVSYMCNDGQFELTNASCSLGCSSQRVRWGDANRCQVNLSSQNHGSTGVYNNNTSLVSGFNYYQDISGSARLTCNDGRIDVSDDSCLYVTELVYSEWGDWFPASPKRTRNCTEWSPHPSTVKDGELYTATRSCDVYHNRTQNVYKKWSDGRNNTFFRTNVEGQWFVSVSQEGGVVGTRERYLVSEGWGDWTTVTSSYEEENCVDKTHHLGLGYWSSTCDVYLVKFQIRQYEFRYSAEPFIETDGRPLESRHNKNFIRSDFTCYKIGPDLKSRPVLSSYCSD